MDTPAPPAEPRALDAFAARDQLVAAGFSQAQAEEQIRVNEAQARATAEAAVNAKFNGIDKRLSLVTWLVVINTAAIVSAMIAAVIGVLIKVILG